MLRDLADNLPKPLRPPEPQLAKPRYAGRRGQGATGDPPAHAITREELPQLVDERAAARILRKSANTLKRWRYEGIGPDYVEIEGRISYDLRVLLEYVRQHTRVPSVRAQMEENS
jgi:hypothetical protein